MSNSPAGPGPDLFFAGGECLTRYGVWVRRTDMDLEAATRETELRDSIASAIGRDGIIREWDPDEARAEWLNEVDLDATRNQLPTTNLFGWGKIDGALLESSGPDAFEVSDPEVTVASLLLLQGATSGDTIQLTYSCLLKKKAGAPTVNFRILDGANVGVVVDPETGLFTASGPPDDFSVVDAGGGYWLCSVTETRTQTIFRAEIIPAWGAPGTLSSGVDNSATGSNTFKQPQVEIGTARTAFQATPRDPDRKFPSLLLEIGSLNGWTFSEELDNAVWNKFRVTIDADVQTAPDDNDTADHITEDVTVSDTHFVNRVLPTGTANEPRSVSGFCKAGARSKVRVTMRFGSDSFLAEFDFANGTVGVPEEFNGASGAVARISAALGDGWYRWSLTGIINPTVTAGANWDLNLLDDAGNPTYDGDGVSGLYLWGVQIETDKPAPSSYIATAGVTATRAADTFNGQFPHPPIEMSIYAKFIESGTAFAPTNTGLYSIGNDNAGADPRMTARTAFNEYRIEYDDGLALVNSSTGVKPQVGDLMEFHVTLSRTGVVQSFVALNGGETVPGNASQGGPLPPAWAGVFESDRVLFFINTRGDTVPGFNRFLAIKAHRGVRSLDFMRAL